MHAVIEKKTLQHPGPRRLLPLWCYIWCHVLHADKEVANSQWCHSQKWESACLQLLSSLINSGSGLSDGKRTAKQGRFMKLVSVAPLYFIFKPLCFGGTHISLLLLIYVILKGRDFFHTLCLGHLSLCALLTYTRQGPANGIQPHICHTSPLSHQPDTRTFPPHHIVGSPNLDATAGKEEERKKMGMKFHQEASESMKGWTRSIYHYSFGRDNRIAVIEFLSSFQVLAQNNLTNFEKQKKKMRE